MKFTPSQDGERRANVALKFRVGRDVMVCCVLCSIGPYLADDRNAEIDGVEELVLNEQLAKLSRAGVERMVRQELHGFGLSVYELQDARGGGELVEKRIVELFPEVGE